MTCCLSHTDIPSSAPAQTHMRGQNFAIFAPVRSILIRGFCFSLNYTLACGVQPDSVYSAYKHPLHTGWGGCSQQLVHFLLSVKSHLSQLLFWREEDGKKECARLSFPVSPSPFPDAPVASFPSLVYLIIPMVSYCFFSSPYLSRVSTHTHTTHTHSPFITLKLLVAPQTFMKFWHKIDSHLFSCTDRLWW